MPSQSPSPSKPTITIPTIAIALNTTIISFFISLIVFCSCATNVHGVRHHQFQILAALPQERAPFISRELRRALEEWELRIKPSTVVPSSLGLDLALFVSPVSVSNDTRGILTSLCESVEMYNPSVVLSLLDRSRSFYASLISQSATVPIVSMTSEYLLEPSLQVTPSNNSSMQMSLDTPISSLADATFELLNVQQWFDAILLIDDSGSSDIISHRLSHLCRSGKDKVTSKGASISGANKFRSSDANYTLDTWRNLMVIQLSRQLPHREFYLRMSEMQTSHRRVIIVHCDRIVTRRIIDTAGKLSLLNGDKIWIFLDGIIGSDEITSPSLWRYLNLPNGVIALRQRAQSIENISTLTMMLKLIGNAAVNTVKNYRLLANGDLRNGTAPEVSCWHNTSVSRMKYSQIAIQELRKQLTPLSSMRSHSSSCKIRNQRNNHVLYIPEKRIWPLPVFDVLNLVPATTGTYSKEWKVVGNVTHDRATIYTVRYIGGPYNEHFAINGGKHRFRIVTNIAPPFVQLSTKLDNNTCLSGDFCLEVFTDIREEIVAIFTDFRSKRREKEGETYHVRCCAGISIDLLNAIARDLNFDYDLYLVADGLFGIRRNGQWDGVTFDLINDVAHMTFTAFSTTSTRVQSIDYSVPFFYSGVSCLSYSKYSEVPFSAFLIPFSGQLWIAIFVSLIAVAISAAIYEWLSPFGLNPWGRQRTKNFSLASALWVMFSLLFSHLVAFKAPKSWPNKVLINIWGAFSVIFLATYTANIAAHFAGLFLIPEIDNFHDQSLMKQKTGTAKSSATEGYLLEKYTDIWSHIQKYKVNSFTEGLEHLRMLELDVLIGDTAILDYFRATDPGCNLRLLGDSIFDDAYAVGMQKGFPLKEAISKLILKYNTYGFLDQLQRKWYGRVHCFEFTGTKPKPLSIRAVAGVFMMLGCGFLVGIGILFTEHCVFKYFLPSLRKKPKECFWKSPNLMFFSQKLYRFINTVELVSPHHSAKEIMMNLKEGQIASLFQKSVKRKAKEEARRRKSKSQFFEMIQEVRKVVQKQQQERSFNGDSIEIPTTRSLDNKKDSVFSETESIAETTIRASSIRFKEPNDSFDEILVRREPIIPNQEFKPPSSLKSSADSRSKLLKSGRASSSVSSGDVGYYYRSPSTPSSISSSHGRPVPNLSQGSVSISLENVSYSGEICVGMGSKKRVNGGESCTPKTWSFDDLALIKKELNEPVSPSERDHSSIMLYEYPPKTTVMIQSPRHIAVIESLRLSSMTKEDILSMWRSSERELLNQLQDVLQQKRALEERVSLLQRMLRKPP